MRGDPSNPDTEHLVERARAGDFDAMERLLARAEVGLRPVLAGILGRWHCGDLEDLMQLARVRIWQRLPAIQQPERFESWVRTIGRNLALDHLRALRRPATFPVPQEPWSPIDPAGDPERRYAAAVCLAHCLAVLTEAQREIFLLRELEGLSYDEIGRQLGISSNTVGPTLAVARRKMMRALESRGMPL